MDHAHATDTSAAERYALGEMGEHEREQYEEHYFDCPECAEDVKAAVIFRENAEAIWQDKPETVREAERRRGPNEDDRPGPRPRNFWDLFWPGPQGALAVAALLLVSLGVTAYQNLAVLPRLRADLQRAEGLQSASWSFLSVSRSEPPVVTISSGQRMVGLTLSQSSDRAYPYYRCELREAQGQTVLAEVVSAPAQGDELQILVPAARLRPGAYVLAVTALESASGPALSESARYPFALRYGKRGKGPPPP